MKQWHALYVLLCSYGSALVNLFFFGDLDRMFRFDRRLQFAAYRIYPRNRVSLLDIKLIVPRAWKVPPEEIRWNCPVVWKVARLRRPAELLGNAGGGTPMMVWRLVVVADMPLTLTWIGSFGIKLPSDSHTFKWTWCLSCCLHDRVRSLTHWVRDKMDAISQTTFWSAFSWMKVFEFRLKFHWSLFLRI